MMKFRLEPFKHAGFMGSMISSFDWTKTPLGDPSTWSAGLISVMGVMLENTIPMCVLWGEERIQIYNDAFIPIQGTKHPSLSYQKPSCG